MTGIVNKTGARSGVLGTTVGTPPTFSTIAPTFTNSIQITPQATEPVVPGSNAGLIWIDSDDNKLRVSDGTLYRTIDLSAHLGVDAWSYTGLFVEPYGTTNVYVFTSSGSLVVNTAITANFLLIGGGGGGGDGENYSAGAGGGGGGSGGYRAVSSQAVAADTYAITIGAGGAGGEGTYGATGSDTSFGSLLTVGGGGGGGLGAWNGRDAPSDGGGGGGGGGYFGDGGDGGTYGYNGGDAGSSQEGGGSGGGSSALGVDSTNDAAKPGGAGTVNNIRDGSTDVTYALGGASGARDATSANPTTPGGANTGTGGAGGDAAGGSGVGGTELGGAGGSGIIIMTFPF